MNAELSNAIQNRQKVKFLYKSEGAVAPQVRVIRPLVYGIHNGVEKLFGSQETPSEHFGSYVVDKIGLITVLDDKFRPTVKESTEPKGWDTIYTTVPPVRLVPRYTEEEETALERSDMARRVKLETPVVPPPTSPEPTLNDVVAELRVLNATVSELVILVKAQLYDRSRSII